MSPQPSEYLFSEQTKTFAVLDGAAIPDLPQKLYQMRAPSICLYRGELPPDIVHVAPYLVQLLPAATFTNWLLTECWGKHWGIFAQTTASLFGMRKHFRSLLTVHDETGKPLLFRFYDPRVLLDFLPSCNAEELATVFGRVKNFWAESDAAEIHRFELAGDKLNQTTLALENGQKKS